MMVLHHYYVIKDLKKTFLSVQNNTFLAILHKYHILSIYTLKKHKIIFFLSKTCKKYFFNEKYKSYSINVFLIKIKHKHIYLGDNTWS